MRRLSALLLSLCISFGLSEIVSAQTLFPNPDLEPFVHGVSSGDPLTDGVIIWTRITPEAGTDPLALDVTWELSEDMTFQDVAASGSFQTDASRDWTVKVDVTGLTPDTWYYYRFTGPDGRYSMTGRTRTAPTGDRDNVRLATASCSSLYSGFFNAYRRIALRNDIDAVLHAGDFIYDFVDDREANRIPDDETLNAITNPIDLEGWRALHAYYHLDPDKRAAMQQHPWIIMWDNHDIGKNYPDNGSMQAFREWTPTRFDDADPERIYRKVSYGDLLEIYMLDINPYRDRPVDIFGDEIDDYGRSILGEEQREWFLAELDQSTAQWRLFCSARPFGQFHAFGLPDILPVDLPGVNDLGLPFSNRSWDGYPREREQIYQFLRERDIDNNIAVSGDIHAYQFNDLVENPYNPFLYLPNGGGVPIGAEFVTGSISRVNLDETVPFAPYPAFGDFVSFLIRLVNPHTIYVDYVNHGYGILDFRPEKTTGEIWLSNKLVLTDEEVMPAAYECRDRRNRWHRGKLTTPSEALYVAAPSAPFEAFEWEDLYVRESTAPGLPGEPDYQLSEVYPNPSGRPAHFRFTSDIDRRITITLHDAVSGAELDRIYEGIVLAGHPMLGMIDIAAVPRTGQYTLVVSGEGFTESRSVVIKR